MKAFAWIALLLALFAITTAYADDLSDISGVLSGLEKEIMQNRAQALRAGQDMSDLLADTLSVNEFEISTIVLSETEEIKLKECPNAKKDYTDAVAQRQKLADLKTAEEERIKKLLANLELAKKKLVDANFDALIKKDNENRELLLFLRKNTLLLDESKERTEIIDIIDKNLAKLDENDRIYKEQRAAMEKAIATIEAELANARKNLGNLDAQLANLDKVIATLKDSLEICAKKETNLNACNDDAAKLARDLAELEAALEKARNVLAAIQTLYNAAEAAVAKAKEQAASARSAETQKLEVCKSIEKDDAAKRAADEAEIARIDAILAKANTLDADEDKVAMIKLLQAMRDELSGLKYGESAAACHVEHKSLFEKAAASDKALIEVTSNFNLRGKELETAKDVVAGAEKAVAAARANLEAQKAKCADLANKVVA